MPSAASRPESPCENRRLGGWAWNPPWLRCEEGPRGPNRSMPGPAPLQSPASMPGPQPSDRRPYTAAHFVLELDGGDVVGQFRSIEGGGIKAEVISYQHGGGFDRWYQLGRPKFEDIKLQVGMSMSHPFYEWIKGFIDKKPTRKNGAIVAADFQHKERARREFKEALIRELVFPKLDGSDKGAAFMTIGIAVEEIVFKPGEGKDVSQSFGHNNQKRWNSC